MSVGCLDKATPLKQKSAHKQAEENDAQEEVCDAMVLVGVYDAGGAGVYGSKCADNRELG
jgi:hypothetical protein